MRATTAAGAVKKFLVKNGARFCLVTVLAIGGLVCQGCHIRDADSCHGKIVSDGIAMAKTGCCIDFQWLGANKWRLSENGLDGGGHGPYLASIKDEPYCRAVRELRGSGLLSRDPNLLDPLFDSTDAEVLLTAMYLYRGEYTDKETPIAARVRSLLKHRDVRVRCMAAGILSGRPFLTVEEIDGMLSDGELCIREIGVESARNLGRHILREINPVWLETVHERPNPDMNEEDYCELNKDLISVLLKHINDNHVYIRSSCHEIFRTQIGKSDDHYCRFVVDPPENWSKHHLWWWVQASWEDRRDRQKELLSWWQEHKDEMRKVSGSPSSDLTSKASP